MRLAYLTGGLAAGVAVAALSTVVVWAVTVLSGSSEPWAVAVWLVPLLAGLAVVATYAAEAAVDRATQARKRSTGEPWAYREDR